MYTDDLYTWVCLLNHIRFTHEAESFIKFIYELVKRFMNINPGKKIFYMT